VMNLLMVNGILMNAGWTYWSRLLSRASLSSAPWSSACVPIGPAPPC